MSEKRFVVRLSDEERAICASLVKAEAGVAAKKRMHAQVLLKIDTGEHGPAWTDEQAAKAFDVHKNTVREIRRRLVEEGFEAALNRKKQARPSRERVLDDDGDKELLAIAKGAPPEGRARWTLHLLAGELVRLDIVPSVSHETVRSRLKKTRSSLTAKLPS